MMKRVISTALVLALAGCGGGIGFGSGGGLFGGNGGGGAPSTAMSPGDDTPRPEARPAGEATAEPTGDGRVLGFSVASLGDATIQGMWLETPLVSAEGPGRVVGPDGRTVVVTLRPSGGAPGSGSRLSLQAMQGLGLDLTSLPTVTVISDG
ncbi:hypothetical protein P6F26_15945 [Roseibacterium sp. SDUM158017]|uniref:hypothetical protein n=1 Tax=Roseicyclus salinarum TaxID=3036773 RepID=UPI00241501B8|nr:hypothetical protein [Roseibacterium sp. SDUM158017]MDG4649938.1 hypothetical protein [Roseibacterium sp. SDUM158017]